MLRCECHSAMPGHFGHLVPSDGGPEDIPTLGETWQSTTQSSWSVVTRIERRILITFISL